MVIMVNMETIHTADNERIALYFHLIHHHHLDSIYFCDSLLYQVQDPPRRGDDNMHWCGKQETVNADSFCLFTMICTLNWPSQDNM